MVFIAIVTLAAALIVPTAGTAAQASRKMRGRIFQHLEAQGDGVVSLVREQYLGQLSPFERNIEKLPLLQPLSRVVELSGCNRGNFSMFLSNGDSLSLIHI